MILTQELVNCQLPALLDKYPELKLMQPEENVIRLHGSILVHRALSDFVLHKYYTIDIFIPTESDLLPYVVDCANQIRTDYHHYYSNGVLCLATDTDIKIHFIEGFNLIEWMDQFVELYFLSYEYYQRYGEFPFGERAHGNIGILQTYQDYLQTNSLSETLLLLRYIGIHEYRGHNCCPCGSGQFMRRCHGRYMLPFYSKKQLKKILLTDLINIEEGIKQSYDSKSYK